MEDRVAKGMIEMPEMPKRRRVTLGLIMRHSVLITFVVLAIAPLLFMVNTSLKTKDEYVFDKIGLPDKVPAW